MLQDIVQGYQAKDQVVLLKSKNEVCKLQNNQFKNIIQSYQNDSISYAKETTNLKEMISVQKSIGSNNVKVEKNKVKKWKMALFIENGIILLFALTVL